MSAPESLTTLPSPTDFQRRSPIYRKLRAADAVFGEVAGGTVPIRYREGGEEDVAREIGLLDLSALPRLGFKGKAVLSEMNTRGVTLDFRPNLAFRQKDGTLAAVLAMAEVLLLSPLTGNAPILDQLTKDWTAPMAFISFPARTAISGSRSPASMPPLCSRRSAALTFVRRRSRPWPSLRRRLPGVTPSSSVPIRVTYRPIISSAIVHRPGTCGIACSTPWPNGMAGRLG